MGMFKQLLERDAIGTHAFREGSLEHRVEVLEEELRQTHRLMKDLLAVLDKSISTGVAGDVHIIDRLM